MFNTISRRSFVAATAGSLLAGLASTPPAMGEEPAAAPAGPGAWTSRGVTLRWSEEWACSPLDAAMPHSVILVHTEAQCQLVAQTSRLSAPLARPDELGGILDALLRDIVANGGAIYQTRIGTYRFEEVQPGVYTLTARLAVDLADDAGNSLQGTYHLAAFDNALLVCTAYSLPGQWPACEPAVMDLLGGIEYAGGDAVVTPAKAFAANGLPSTGAGTVYLGAAGQVADETEPLAIETQGWQLVQMCVGLEGAEAGDYELYVDGTLEQLLSVQEDFPGAAATLELAGDALVPGTHAVEIVRFEANSVAFYRAARYEAL